jgi:hypothetical protein
VGLRSRSCLRQRDHFSHQAIRRPHHQICAAGLSQSTNSGDAEDEYEKFEKAIAAIEDELSNRFQEEDDLTNPWGDALAMSRQSLRLEIDFLAKAEFLRPVRHLDMRRSVQIDCLKNRLAYLTILKSEFDRATNDRV